MRSFLRHAAAFLVLYDVNSACADVHLGMGFRVGEVTQTSAIVWTRLTAQAEPNWKGRPPEPKTSNTRVLVENLAIPPDQYEGAMPGAAGEVRLVWSTRADFANAQASAWVAVDAGADCTHQFPLCDLRPGTRYYLRAEARAADKRIADTATGSFATAADQDAWQDVRFTMTTCQMYYHRDDPGGFCIYPAMATLKPDFFIAGGDNVYYDRDNPRAKTIPLCRLHWNRMYALPKIVDFCRHVPGYWMKDDHDTFFDDCWPAYKAPWIEPLTYAEGVAVYREQVPIGKDFDRTVRWGKGLQVWFVEVRDFRSPNTDKDGPNHTVWGQKQKDWLMQSILASDAAFKIIASPTAIVGPDNPGQRDSHANAAFAHEGKEFRLWTRQQKLSNLYICSGDRHWQYMSTDPESGLREFSCGPASDEHAFAGPGNNANYHQFYRPKGGFLSVAISRTGDVPNIHFRFHDVDGKVLHEFADKTKEQPD